MFSFAHLFIVYDFLLLLMLLLPTEQIIPDDEAAECQQHDDDAQYEQDRCQIGKWKCILIHIALLFFFDFVGAKIKKRNRTGCTIPIGRCKIPSVWV